MDWRFGMLMSLVSSEPTEPRDWFPDLPTLAAAPDVDQREKVQAQLKDLKARMHGGR